MTEAIEAKSILSRTKNPDAWFGVVWNMNLYRGCQHGCIYCDSRSECYRIERFDDVLVKSNAIPLLKKELSQKREINPIGTGAMSDPYTPLEKEWNLTGRALALIADFGFPLHLITKSDLILRDLDTLKRMVFASVSFTLTTTDDALAAIVEPLAPPPSARLHAMRVLSEAGIYVGVLMMPVLPFLEDNEANILSIVERSAAAGARYIIPWFGMSLRDRQREYYYQKLDEHFPGLRERYEKKYGEDYNCSVPQGKALSSAFRARCAEKGIVTDMKKVQRYTPQQLSLLSMFDGRETP
ncbi:MAG: SPL family radical SAM protein [Bacteroidota bacterium]